MGAINNVRRAWRALLGKAAPKVDRPNPAGMEVAAFNGGGGYGAYKRTDYLEEMRGWVFACVNAIADQIAAIELKLYRLDSKGQAVEIYQHPLLDLLYRVNKFTTFFDHLWLTSAYLELVGEAPWFLEKANGEVTNIFILRPDKLRPIPSKQTIIGGYMYNIGGKEVPLTVDEVIFLKFPNPAKTLRGIGTLEAAAKTVDIDNAAEDWNVNFFKNNATPAATLTIDQEQMSEEQQVKLKESLRKNYEGTEKAHQVMVLFGNMKMEKIGFSQRDMSFDEMQRSVRDKILGLFRVPKAVIAQTEGTNFASAKVAQYAFSKWTIQPKVERIVQQLNEFLVPMFDKTGQLFLDYDNVVPDDDEALVKKYTAALNPQSGWMTRNEVREEQGLKPVDDPAGDTVAGTTVVVPKVVARPQAESADVKFKANADVRERFGKRVPQLAARTKLVRKVMHVIEDKVREEAVKQVERDEQIKAKLRVKIGEFNGTKNLVKSIIRENLKKHGEDKGLYQHTSQLTNEDCAKYWEICAAVADQHYEQMREAVQKAFAEQEREVVATLGLKSVTVDGHELSAARELARFKESTMPILMSLWEKSQDTTFALIGVDLTPDASSRQVQEILSHRIVDFTLETTKTTNERIRSIFVEAAKVNKTPAEIADDLRAFFGESQKARATLIARTESQRVANAANLQAFKDSGVVKGKRWQVEPGHCEFCGEMDGKVMADLDGAFAKDGELLEDSNGSRMTVGYGDVVTPPLHPNCRCQLAPIYEDIQP